MKLLSAATRISTPWKNGGGTTAEIAVHPPGSGLDTFGWRISIAQVRAGGPFSLFPGIDRCLAVLEGTMTLAIADRPALVVSAATPPALFPGDVPTSATLTGGPVTDLNIMTRRGQFSARLSTLAGAITLAPRSVGIALALNGFALGTHGLAPHDAIQLAAGEEVSFPAGAHFHWIEIDAQNR